MTDIDQTGQAGHAGPAGQPEEPVSAAPAAAAAASAPGIGMVPAGTTVPRAGGTREVLYFALRNGKLVGGLVVTMGFLVLGLVGPWFVAGDPNAYVGLPAQPPSGEYLFGTTTFGQDVFAQFVHGLRSTFFVGVFAGALAGVIGMLIGFTAGYRGGIVDELLTMLTNIFLVLPVLAVLLIIAAYLQVRNIELQATIIGLFSWPWVARAVRAQTFSLRSRDFVDLAKLSGAPVRKIIFREIAPNMASYLFMVFIILFGGSVLFAATLDFIGLGPTEGVSLGLMLNNAVKWSALHLGLWWWFIPPGLGITAIVGALYVMNVGLDEVFNPKLREK